MIYTKDNVKNLSEVASESAAGVRLYYSIADGAVYTKDDYIGKSRWFVTEFARKNTEEEVLDALNRYLNM